MPVRRLLATAVLSAAAVLLAGCGSGTTGGSDPDTAPDDAADAPGAVEATPPALAAAVLAHYDRPLLAATALIPGPDAYPYAPPGSTGTELVLDYADDVNLHVRVLVADEGLSTRYDRSRCRTYECVDVGSGGVDAQLVWETGYPEEDPGLVSGTADAGDHVVRVTAFGPFITEEHDDSELVALGEAVTAVVLDPAVAPRTSASYAAGGDDLCSSPAWRDWYGQGNGTVDPPRGFVDWCADAG